MELPLLGPSVLRDVPAKVVDTYTNPQQYIHDPYVKYGLYLPYLIDKRAPCCLSMTLSARLRPIRLHSRRVSGESRISDNRKSGRGSRWTIPDADMPDTVPASPAPPSIP